MAAGLAPRPAWAINFFVPDMAGQTGWNVWPGVLPHVGILVLLLVLVILLLVRANRIKNQSIHAAGQIATRLRVLADNAPLMIRAHDANGTPLFWNRECERVTGFEAARIVGNPDAWTLLHPDPTLRAEARTLRSAPPRDYSGRISVMTCADGSTRIISWTSVSATSPVPEWHNWETGVDITARHAAAEALKERDLRQKAILDNIPDVAWLKDKSLRLMAVNRKFIDLTELTEKDLLGRTGLDIWPVEYSGPAMETDWLVLREGRPLWSEEMVPVRGGEPAWHETFRAPIHGVGGEVVGIAGVGRDITEKRKTARELVLAKERAEEASKTKNEFLANMSHEVRTPLNGILGMLQLMLSTDMTEEQQGYIMTAIGSSKRLSRLLADILDISKIEAGQLEIVSEPFAVAELGESIQDIFHLAAIQNNIGLRVQIAPDVPPRVVGDAARLRQILFNLVGNSFKFTTQGEISVDISCLRREKAQCWLLFSVADTGSGIPEAMLDKVFESFTQADASTSQRHGGVGLGLAIVRRLAELMGASLAISSAPSEGTEICLSLTLPVAQDAEETRECGTDTTARPLRFLVAEDDLINQMAITRLLEKKGHHVQCVRNGVELLDRITSTPFDLILMDVQMPEMDGLEATRHIRLLPEFESVRDIPIIALTACAMAGDRERFLAAGMNNYAAKPVDWKILANMIEGLWQNGEHDRRGSTGTSTTH
jgi:PAS domain S-box-containing protein